MVAPLITLTSEPKNANIVIVIYAGDVSTSQIPQPGIECGVGPFGKTTPRMEGCDAFVRTLVTPTRAL